MIYNFPNIISCDKWLDRLMCALKCLSVYSLLKYLTNHSSFCSTSPSSIRLFDPISTRVKSKSSFAKYAVLRIQFVLIV